MHFFFKNSVFFYVFQYEYVKLGSTFATSQGYVWVGESGLGLETVHRQDGSPTHILKLFTDRIGQLTFRIEESSQINFIMYLY